MISFKERFSYLLLGIICVYGSGYIMHYFDFINAYPFWFGFPTFLILFLFWVCSFLIAFAAVFLGWKNSNKNENEGEWPS